MAKEGPCVKCWAALIGILIVVLGFTGVLSPFLEKVWAFVSKSEPLSTPAPLWQQRLGGTPVSATIAGNTVVVEHRTLVEARSLGTGSRLWERKADWAAVTGGGGSSAVVVGKLLVKGYEVLDPSTGAVIRRDSDAVAVWTYRNAMLDVRCFDAARLHIDRVGPARLGATVDGADARHRLRPVRRQPRHPRHRAPDGQPDRGPGRRPGGDPADARLPDRRQGVRRRHRRRSGAPGDEAGTRRAHRRRRRAGAADHRRVPRRHLLLPDLGGRPGHRPGGVEQHRDQPAYDQRGRVHPAVRPGRRAQRGGRRRAGHPGDGPRRVRRKRPVAGRARAAAGRGRRLLGARRVRRRPHADRRRAARRGALGSTRQREGAGLAGPIRGDPARPAARQADRDQPGHRRRAAQRAVESRGAGGGPAGRGHRRRPRHRVRPVPRHHPGRPVAGRARRTG